MQLKLKRFLQKDFADTVQPVLQLANIAVGIYDAEGQFLLGQPQEDGESHPVKSDEDIVGWVKGQENAAFVAQLLTELLNQAIEKKQLANEVLDKYREINLLYTIAERLTACRELNSVVTLALEEAQRLIKATGGAVHLLNSDTSVLEAVNSEISRPFAASVALGEGFEGYVAQTGKAEIVNDVCSDPRHVAYADPNLVVRSLLCAPLKKQEQVVGVITIYHSELVNYAAGDLKLLTAIALQSTPVIESTLFYQKQIEEARIREEQLQSQIAALRVEIDHNTLQQKVAEITEADFFQQLQEKVKQQRKASEKKPKP